MVDITLRNLQEYLDGNTITVAASQAPPQGVTTVAQASANQPFWDNEKNAITALYENGNTLADYTTTDWQRIRDNSQAMYAANNADYVSLLVFEEVTAILGGQADLSEMKKRLERDSYYEEIDFVRFEWNALVNDGIVERALTASNTETDFIEMLTVMDRFQSEIRTLQSVFITLLF